MSAANNLAVRYLANKALQREEAQEEEAAVEDLMAQRRYCFTFAGKRCKDECLYNIFEEGMPEWKKATARAAREDHEVGKTVKDESNTATLTPETFYPRNLTKCLTPSEIYTKPRYEFALQDGLPLKATQDQPNLMYEIKDPPWYPNKMNPPVRL